MCNPDNFGSCEGGIGRKGVEGAEDGPTSTAVFGNVLTSRCPFFGSRLGSCGDRGGAVVVLSVAGLFWHGEAFCRAVRTQLLFKFPSDSIAYYQL